MGLANCLYIGSKEFIRVLIPSVLYDEKIYIHIQLNNALFVIEHSVINNRKRGLRGPHCAQQPRFRDFLEV